MSDHFGDNSISRHLLTIGGITIVMSQLASLHPWIAGLSTFLVLMIVMATIALKGDPHTTRMLAMVSAFLATGASWFPGSDLSVSIAVFVSVLGTSSLALLSWLVCRASQRRQQQIADLEQQQNDLVRKLYDHEKNVSKSGEIPSFALPTIPEETPQCSENLQTLMTDIVSSPNAALADREFFDFAMLLLSMQRIGHRLSAELDLSSLVTAILETANELLHCRRSELHLWDARAGRLKNAIIPNDPRVNESIQFVLSQAEASPATFEWVTANRRILTRRDVVSGRVSLGDIPNEALHSAIAPLLVGEELIGLLVVDDADDDGPTFVRMLYILANHCAMGLKNAQLFRHIGEMARHDSLTGLLNHAAFLDALDPLIDNAIANQQPLTLVMSDIDHFKAVNDTYGHQAGDKVLQEVSRWWRAIMPDHAILARYGGEEFICALPGENHDRGWELAEMLRVALESHPVSHNGAQIQVTASFGISEFGRPATHPARLIRLADKALYRAKESGRNRIESHDPDRHDSADLGESASFFLAERE